MQVEIYGLLNKGFKAVRKQYKLRGKYWVNKKHHRLRLLVLSDCYCILAPIPLVSSSLHHSLSRQMSCVLVKDTPKVIEERDNYVKYVTEGVQYEVIRSADNRLYWI